MSDDVGLVVPADVAMTIPPTQSVLVLAELVLVGGYAFGLFLVIVTVGRFVTFAKASPYVVVIWIAGVFS